MHYFIRDQSNKWKALKKSGHPSWKVDSIQFNLYKKDVIANIQNFDVESGEESNHAVLIPLESLKEAYEALSK